MAAQTWSGPTTATAWSLGGRRFSLDAPLVAHLPVGSLVEIDAVAGRFLGQVVETSSRETDDGGGRRLLAEGTLLARVDGDDVVAAASDDSFPDAPARPASDALIAAGRSALSGGPSLRIGRLRQPSSEPARLVAAGFNRHTFMCGQSGSGKTYSLGVVLERVLRDTRLRVVVIDPNSDYVGLDQLDGVRGVEGSPDPGSVTVFRAKGAHRLQVRYGRLPLLQQAMVLRLDPLADLEEYALLRRTSERLGTTEYSMSDLRQALEEQEDLSPGSAARRLALRIDNLGAASWGIWAGRDEAPLLAQLPEDWRAFVVDLGGVAHAEERTAVVSSILTGLWMRRTERSPVLVVIDEAHNVCPRESTDPQQALGVEHTVRIAAEGRKYGLYLLLATQSPGKLHPGVLSQCENLLLMKTNSASDVDHLAEVFSHVPRGLIAQAPAFGLGEGLVAGRISPTPQLFRSGERLSPQGGEDVPTTWADPASPAPPGPVARPAGGQP